MRRAACISAAATLSLLAAACSSSSPPSGTASSPAAGTETFYGTTPSTANHPTIPLKATGLFTDTGSIHLTGGNGAGTGVLKLTRGTLTVQHSKNHNGPSSVNKATCQVKFSVTGTFKVLSGTGAYKGTTGAGTYLVTFGGTLPKKPDGKCNLANNAAPVNGTSLTTFKATGPLTAR